MHNIRKERWVKELIYKYERCATSTSAMKLHSPLPETKTIYSKPNPSTSTQFKDQTTQNKIQQATSSIAITSLSYSPHGSGISDLNLQNKMDFIQ